MAGYWNRVTGEKLEFATPEALRRARLARMRRNVWLGVAGLAKARETQGGLLTMYTLTYAKPEDWGPRTICNCMRWLRRQGVRLYVWVAELQRRGAVHYHVLVLLPEGQRWRKPNAEDGGWSKGFTWVTPDVQRPFYIMKYLQKGQGHEGDNAFPKGLRLYAVAQAVVRGLEFDHAVDWREGHLPAWAACDTKDDSLVLSSRRVVGGVRYGGQVEYTPYSARSLPDMEYVAWKMTCAW